MHLSFLFMGKRWLKTICDLKINYLHTSYGNNISNDHQNKWLGISRHSFKPKTSELQSAAWSGYKHH